MATESACLLIAESPGTRGTSRASSSITPRTSWPTSWARSSARCGPFRLAKLEGDAAFTFAITDRMDGSLLLDTIERCYFGFRRVDATSARRRPASATRACGSRPQPQVRRPPRHDPAPARRRPEELLGSDVILVHRLLKNDVVDLDGDPGVRAVHPAVRRRDGCRCGGARHAPDERDLRAHRDRAGVGPRPRTALAGGRVPHARHRRRAAGGLRDLHTHHGAAAGRLGVRDHPGPTDRLAARVSRAWR